eukprot:COSAG04_NODE_21479_length_373_cov_0.740876_1_plen_77_part_10
MQAETPPRRGAPNLPYYLVILLATLRSDSQLYDHVHGALCEPLPALVRPAPPARPPFCPPPEPFLPVAEPFIANCPD